MDHYHSRDSFSSESWWNLCDLTSEFWIHDLRIQDLNCMHGDYGRTDSNDSLSSAIVGYRTRHFTWGSRSRPRSNSGGPGHFMSKLSYSNHNIRLCESFLTMYRSRGCRQGPDTSRRLLLCWNCSLAACTAAQRAIIGPLRPLHSRLESFEGLLEPSRQYPTPL